MKRILSLDQATRTQTNHVYDPATGKTHIETVQDCQPIIEHCKRLANNPEYKRQGIKEDWYHFATVPNEILIEIRQKYGLNFMAKDDLPKIEKVLARDYKKLLTVDKI